MVEGSLVMVDREALLAELRQVFDTRTAEVLLRALDKVAMHVRDEGVRREDFRELKQVVAGLAEAQRRTTEEMQALVEAQRQTSVAVAGLTGSMDRLRKQVGGLSETVGGDIEDIAYIVLYDVLKRAFGWQVGVLERSWQRWNGRPEEVNIFGQAKDPAKPERTLWIVGEAKHNLTAREAQKFVRQAGRAQRHLVGEVFAVCFCYRARPEVQQMIRDAGIRLVFSYGKLV